MKFPFHNPTYAQVETFFQQRVGKSRSRKIDAGARLYRAYWSLPREDRDGDAFDGHYVWRDAEGVLSWYMNKTAIVEWYPDGRRYINHGGWLSSPTTRDALRTLADVRTRCLPRTFDARLDQHDRLMTPGYSHGVPFPSLGLWIDPDGVPVPPVNGEFTDSVRVTDDEARCRALAFRRRVQKLAAPVLAVWPDNGDSSEYVSMSTHSRRNWLGALADATTDEGLVETLVRLLNEVTPRTQRGAATFMAQLLDKSPLFAAFDVYEMKVLPSRDLTQYLPSPR